LPTLPWRKSRSTPSCRSRCRLFVIGHVRDVHVIMERIRAATATGTQPQAPVLALWSRRRATALHGHVVARCRQTSSSGLRSAVHVIVDTGLGRGEAASRAFVGMGQGKVTAGIINGPPIPSSTATRSREHQIKGSASPEASLLLHPSAASRRGLIQRLPRYANRTDDGNASFGHQIPQP